MPTSPLEKPANIGSAVSDCYQFLKELARTKSLKKRKRLLKRATSQQLLALVEICLNIVRARIRLTVRQKKRMLPYADFVRRMGRMRSERGARKTLQKGNGLPLSLFPAIITPIILEIAKSLQQKNGQ